MPPSWDGCANSAVIEAEPPVVGDFQTGLMIIDAIAADYGGGPDRSDDEPAAPSPVLPAGVPS
jgi:hypothetical protein